MIRSLRTAFAGVLLAAAIGASAPAHAATFTLVNRTLAGATVNGVTGATYAADTNGFITGVAQLDVAALLNNGWKTPGALDNDTANNLPAAAIRVPLLSCHNAAGTTIAAAASSGEFGISITLGTSGNLVGEAAQGNTKTDNVLCEFRMPDNYVAGANITVTANVDYSGSGTAGTVTVVPKVYRAANAGTQGANLVTTSAATLTASAADDAFTATGTTLNPGDVVEIEVTMVVQETGGSATLTGALNSLRIN